MAIRIPSRAFRWAPAAVLLLCCALTGCEDEPGPSTTDSTTEPTACNSNGDCGTGLVCSSGVCTAESAANCTSNGDCPPGQECVEGLCSAAPTNCTTNSECAEGESCLGGVCAAASALVECNSNGDCADGAECLNGVCVTPEAECTTNGDCADGEICTNGTCVVPEPTPTVSVLNQTAEVPYILRFDLRLQDVEGAPITQGVTADSFRVFENGHLLDLAETNQFVTAGPNLPLKIVLVLDYTSSMAASQALGPMIDAAEHFIWADYFTATHHLGVVEFHDRDDEGVGFSLAVPLTVADPESDAGKAAIAAGLPGENELENGLSRAWDAVDLALRTLSATERQTSEFQAVVFLTDGRDTTSTTAPEDLLATALADQVLLYPIGFDPATEDEAVLQNMAAESGGAYFPARDATDLDTIFAGVVEDLRGQWNLTYITQHNTGAVSTLVEFDWDGYTTSFAYDFDAGQIAGDVHQGLLEVPERWIEPNGSATHFLLRATYLPRNVDRFRFQFGVPDVDFALQGTGGLVDPAAGWTVTTPADGIVEVSGTEPLPYGAFGNLGVATLPGEVAVLQVSHDDSIYADLSQPKTMVIEGSGYSAPYRVVVTIDPEEAGVVEFDPDRPVYAAGDVVSLTAQPAGRHVFSAWSGDTVGTNGTTTLTMDADKQVTATFYPPRILTTVVSPTAAGLVSRSPDQTDYAHGSMVTLGTIASGNYVFSRWEGAATGTGDTLDVTMDGEKSITAVFYPPRMLTVTVQPAGAGTVQIGPSQTNYPQGMVVTLVAIPAAQRSFTSWSGAASGTATITTVTMDGDKTVTATFN